MIAQFAVCCFSPRRGPQRVPVLRVLGCERRGPQCVPVLCVVGCERSFQQLVSPFQTFVFHFIASNKTFLAVCSLDLTVPAGSPSTAPTRVASMSSTKESCRTLRSFSGKLLME